jgi:hypothetical protein
MKKIILCLSLALLLLIGAGSAHAQTSGAMMSSPASIPVSLTLGAKGDAVITLQQFLIAKGYLHTATSTGFYGNLTAKAVSDFQAANSLPQVGRVGPKTLVLINAQILAQPTSDTQSNVTNDVAVNTGIVVNTPPMPVPTSPCNGGAMYNSVTGALCSAPLQQVQQQSQVGGTVCTIAINPISSNTAVLVNGVVDLYQFKVNNTSSSDACSITDLTFDINKSSNTTTLQNLELTNGNGAVLGTFTYNPYSPIQAAFQFASSNGPGPYFVPISSDNYKLRALVSGVAGGPGTQNVSVDMNSMTVMDATTNLPVNITPSHIAQTVSN